MLLDFSHLRTGALANTSLNRTSNLVNYFEGLVQSTSVQSELDQNTIMAQATKSPQLSGGTSTNDSNEPSMTYSVSNTKVMAEIEEKRHENLVLERRKSEAEVAQSAQSEIFVKLRESLSEQALTVIVFGASGHLAKTKTYPALYALFCEGIFPENVQIVGSVHNSIHFYIVQCIMY